MLLNTPKKKIVGLFTLFMITTIIFYLFFDQPIAKWIKEHLSQKMISLATLLTYPLEPLIIPLYLLAALKLCESSKKLVGILINFGAATLTTITLISLLKFILTRPRPLFFLTHGVSHIMPLQFVKEFVSMPSGHAGGAGLLTAFILILAKGKARALIIIPLLLALLRIVSLKHFSSDVILGFGIGFSLTLMFHLNDGNFFDKLKELVWKIGKLES